MPNRLWTHAVIRVQIWGGKSCNGKKRPPGKMNYWWGAAGQAGTWDCAGAVLDLYHLRSAVGKTLCQVLGTRVHSKMHKPLPSRKCESRIETDSNRWPYHTSKVKWGLGKVGWFCMHSASLQLLKIIHPSPHSIRVLPFHLPKSLFSSLPISPFGSQV